MLISMCYVVHIASSFVKWELAKILSANEINLSTYLLEYCEISNYPLLCKLSLVKKQIHVSITKNLQNMRPHFGNTKLYLKSWNLMQRFVLV